MVDSWLDVKWFKLLQVRMKAHPMLATVFELTLLYISTDLWCPSRSLLGIHYIA